MSLCGVVVVKRLPAHRHDSVLIFIVYSPLELWGSSVSKEASVGVCSEGGVLRLPSLAYQLFCVPNCWGLASLTKLNTEMRICRTTFGIVTLIFEPLDRYLCWWMIRSSPSIYSAQ